MFAAHDLVKLFSLRRVYHRILEKECPLRKTYLIV